MRLFAVNYTCEQWKNDEETETFKHRVKFECDVTDQIDFNGKGIFGIVSKAFSKIKGNVKVVGVRELADFERDKPMWEI